MQHPGPRSVQQSPVPSQNASEQYTSAPAVQQNILQPAPVVSGTPTPLQVSSAQGPRRDADQVGTPQSVQDSSELSASTEPAQKKRKRTLKKNPEPQGAGILESPVPGDVLSTKLGETDALPLPGCTSGEVAAIDRFKKRTYRDIMGFPPVAGAPYLVKAGTVKLPGECQLLAVSQFISQLVLTMSIVPRSYDKLTPLVAMPSQSGRCIFPEEERNLPCEIQGKFSANFKPSPNGSGLEDRRRDAKDALAEYDKSMEALGNHRPKYTEYPRMLKLYPCNAPHPFLVF